MNDLSRGTPLEPRPYRTLDIFTVTCAVAELAPDVHALGAYRRALARQLGASQRVFSRGSLVQITPPVSVGQRDASAGHGRGCRQPLGRLFVVSYLRRGA